MVTFGLKLGDAWLPVEAYLDSGAAYTVLFAELADGAGFDYRKGRLTYLQVGDGSRIPVYLHDLEIQLGTERFIANIGFSDRLGVPFNLLGRDGIFTRFKICFQERLRVVTFESRDGEAPPHEMAMSHGSKAIALAQSMVQFAWESDCYTDGEVHGAMGRCRLLATSPRPATQGITRGSAYTVAGSPHPPRPHVAGKPDLALLPTRSGKRAIECDA